MSNLAEREIQAKQLVSEKVKQIQVLLNGDKAKASAYGSTLMSLSMDNKLKDCDVDSIISVGFQIVQAGLNPNPLFNEAYVVPYQVKKDGRVVKTVAQLQVGAKGYVTLAYRAGWTVKSRMVYNCDVFNMQLGDFDEKFELIPNYDEQNPTDPKWVFNNVKGILVMAKDSHGEVHKQFIPNSKIEKIRLGSPNQTDSKAYTYIWKDWTEELYSAKGIKYVLKRLPISDTVREVIHADEEVERLPAPKNVQPQNVDHLLLSTPTKNKE